jgi:hypothetical protein
VTDQGRADAGLPPLPADIPFAVYGLTGEFTGRRWLDVWNRLGGREDWPVSHVNLGHGTLGGPHVVVITDAKLPQRRWSETARIGPTGVADAAVWAQLGMLHWGLPPDAAGARSERFHDEARQLSGRPEHLDTEPWQDAVVMADGMARAVRYREMGRAWAAAVDLGQVAVAIYGIGMRLDQVRLVPVNSRLARNYQPLAPSELAAGS